MVVTNMVGRSKLSVTEQSVIHKCEHLIIKVGKRYREVKIHNRPMQIFMDEHPMAVGKSAVQLGRTVGLTERELLELAVAAPLHDVGKAHEDMAGLLRWFTGKPLTMKLRKIVTKTHTRLGPKMLDLIEEFEGFDGMPYNRRLAEEICLYHHPHIDPQRKKRSTQVKIVSITDQFDARTSVGVQRSHKKSCMSYEVAAREMLLEAEQGWLDRDLTRIFFEECLKLKVVNFS
ncbi:MAG: HD domain-containing protein [Candidatus Doudnabacteria bacterium]|nr:HD domain-containing protein [Candidatus Doudnabacteria bacterium]